jgi:hypothetical protein
MFALLVVLVVLAQAELVEQVVELVLEHLELNQLFQVNLLLHGGQVQLLVVQLSSLQVVHLAPVAAAEVGTELSAQAAEQEVSVVNHLTSELVV